MAFARSRIEQVRKDVETFMKPDPDGHAQDVAIARLSEMPGVLRDLLSRFNVSEAAYLDGGMGEKLARAFGSASASIMAITRLLDFFTAARKLDAVATPQQRQAYREEVQKLATYALTIFDSAVTRLGEFTDYCEGLGFLRSGSRE
jgi:hypothetical protein